MLFCNRGSKVATPPTSSKNSHDYASSRIPNVPVNDVVAGKWQLPSILTAGSLDEISVSNPLLPEAPVMPAALEAQLATLSNLEMSENEKIERNSRYSNRRPQQLLSSVSMHSLVSSITSQDYTRSHISKKGSANLSEVVDGNLSLPIAHKKHHHYSGLSLLSLRHHRSDSNTLRKLRSLDVQQFSFLLDFEERYNDPWVGSISLRRTAKPNLENESHRENSLFLSVLEAKGLDSKRRYYCDICLDRTLYARTTSKQCAGNGVFWAEEFDLNNLPEVSILTVSLYREAESSMKDGKRGLIVRSNSKKASKKFQNRLVGFVTLPVANVCTRNPSQMWLTLQPPENADSINSILLSPSEICRSNFGASASSAIGSTGVQLRVSVRYKSIEVLPISAYLPLHALVRGNGIEFTEWFEYLIPLKLKEEVSSCFVNLHELDGTATSFLSSLVIREVSNLENESMTFRSNTMATKAVESYIKLVGKEYLHNLLYRYIQQVLLCTETWEVDPDKLSNSSLSSGTLLSLNGLGTSAPATLIIQDYCARKRLSSSDQEQLAPGSGLARLAVLNNGRVAQPGSLVFSQTQLLQHLDLVWDALYASRSNFPKPLLEVFSSFRAVLQPTKGAEFCDKLISACIFLRFICPAILTPSLFGLTSTFPSESNCQRNLTLVAKSLQSLANLSAFGEKEPFMRFMNAYVESQIPVMQHFLRDISSMPGVLERRDQLASPVASSIDPGYELACLQNVCHELFTDSSSHQYSSTVSSIFATGSGKGPISSLPPSLVRLPEIITQLEKLKNKTTTKASCVDPWVASDFTNVSIDLHKRLPSTLEVVTITGAEKELKNSLPTFCLAVEESMSDISLNNGLYQPIMETSTMNSPIQRPKALRPSKMRIQASSPGDQQLLQQHSSLNETSMALSKKCPPAKKKEDDRTTLKEAFKVSVFASETVESRGVKATLRGNDVDYDDPYIEDAYESASCRKTIYDAPYEDETGTSTQESSGGGSPIHVIQFPLAPSAFSLYRRPLTSGRVTSSEVLQMESSSSPFTMHPSYAFSTVDSSPHNSPRKLHPYRTDLTGGPVKTSSVASNTHTNENLVLEPRPNLIITHLKPRPSRCTTTSSSGPSSTTNNNGSYPFRQDASVTLGSCSSGVNVHSSASVTAASKMPSSVNTVPSHTTYDPNNESMTKAPPAVEDSGAKGIANSRSLGITCGADSRPAQATRKSNGLVGSRCQPSTAQPVSVENERLLTSTLEELGDAVAWLEKERNGLLNMHERRLSSSNPRSRQGHGNSFGSLSLPSKCPALAINTPAAPRISPTSTPGTAAAQQRLHSNTTPSLSWLNYIPSPTDKAASLTKSTSSLTDQTIPKYKHQRSSVSKTLAMTRSGSVSVSPSRRSRESSDSSDNTSGQRTRTIVLASKVTPLSLSSNGWHRPTPQTPVGIRKVTSKGDHLEESNIILHPYRRRPHPASFVSTSNCNLFVQDIPSPHSAAAVTNVVSGDIEGPRRRGPGELSVLSSSILTS